MDVMHIISWCIASIGLTISLMLSASSLSAPPPPLPLPRPLLRRCSPNSRNQLQIAGAKCSNYRNCLHFNAPPARSSARPCRPKCPMYDATLTANRNIKPLSTRSYADSCANFFRCCWPACALAAALLFQLVTFSVFAFAVSVRFVCAGTRAGVPTIFFLLVWIRSAHKTNIFIYN